MSSSNESDTEMECLSETDADFDQSEESISKERNETECSSNLLEIKQDNALGFSSISRPRTYPYISSFQISVPTNSQEQCIISNNFKKGNKSSADPTKSRLSVIQSCKKQEIFTTPIDLTTKQPNSAVKYTKSDDILVSSSEPTSLHSVVKTIKSVPVHAQSEWTPELTNKTMFHAYLTERYMKDSKTKDQYRLNDKKYVHESILLSSSNLCNLSVHDQENETNSKYLQLSNKNQMFERSDSYNIKSDYFKNDIVQNSSSQNINKSEYKISNNLLSKTSLEKSRDSKQQNSEIKSIFQSDSNEITQVQHEIKKIVADKSDIKLIPLNKNTFNDAKSKSEFIQPSVINTSYMR